MMKIFYVILFLFSLLAFACEDLKPCDEAEQDLEILQYLEDHNLVAEKHESGLYYIIDDPGGTIRPLETSTVSVIYKGYLTDKDTTVFDDSNGLPRTFGLSGVIEGWTIGMQLFKKGGKGTLFIPCHLGYGERKTGVIPPSSVLIFEIELTNVR